MITPPADSPLRVLVTGASRGIGKHIAREFTARGHSVMLCARDEHLLHEECAVVQAHGGKAQYVVCDVGDPLQIHHAVQHTVRTLGRIDIAVLNAGMSAQVHFNDVNLDDYHRVMNVNLHSVVAFIKELVPGMKAQGSGTIVGVSSLADSRPIPGNSVYVASKAALTVLLESASMELRPHGISVVTVRPGFVRTDMTANNRTPMPMLMSAERAAGIIVRGILQGRTIVAFPLPMAVLSAIGKLIPSRLWKWLFRVR